MQSDGHPAHRAELNPVRCGYVLGDAGCQIVLSQVLFFSGFTRVW